MPPKKRKIDDTTLLSPDSDSGSDSASEHDDNDELEEYYYESLSINPTTGRTVYSASIVSAAVPASPSKPAVVYPPRRTDDDQTWIYDFMDNDWSFAVEEPPPHSDDEEDVPEERDSEVEDDATLKREPYRPLKKWKGRYRWTWLNELVRGEGRGDHAGHPTCVCEHPSCQGGVAELRCKDCHGCEGLAAECMVREHRRNPLHRIEKWNWEEGCFDDISLKSLGLRFELGRELHPHRVCPRPKRAPGKKFVVIDGNGLHDVELWYCDCGKGPTLPVQLLRMKWLPSTGKYPKTAATFNVMRRYHLLSLESKCSMAEFYNSLARLTNNTGEPPATRYQEFMNMTRIWRNLQMLKRAGRAHETDGIARTKPGACAIECPACPHPGKNIPPNWKDVPLEKRFLYALFLALDANFRMQRKDVSSETKDADLGNGLAFFGEVNAYMAHLAEHWDQPQPKSTCVVHDAVNTPDKEVRGTASSGIGTVDCARHNMKRPKGVGDLQRGERYLNMDYMFFKSIEGSDTQLFFVSYDIACQWHKNIWDRMRIYSRDIRHENGKRFFVFLVPKFHLPAHIESCNISFSFLLTRYVGQTDGESPERGWANINRLATSTREMGPHLRREILDDHFNDWNWKKILAMGVYMFDRIRYYIPAMVKTRRDTLEQEASLPAETLVEWTAATVAWEADASKPNPFERTTQEKSLASVRYELAQEGGGAVRGETESSEMLAQGVQLEETQRQLKFDQAATGTHPTIEQKRTMLERCSKARHKILTWMGIQTSFMPEVGVLRAAAAEKRAEESGLNPVAGELVQDMPLLLPSALAPDVQCLRELQEFKFRLREGQAHEALHEMRHQLLVRAYLYKYKDVQVANNRDTMRSLTQIAGIDNHIKRVQATYNVARKALEVLGPRVEKTGWEKVLKVLHNDDVRQMPEASFRRPGGGKKRKESADEKKRRRTNASRPISWIWLADGSAADADRNHAMNEALRIEWAKTRALGLRNTEEVDMLEEEMRRTPVYLRWHANWWDSLKIHTGDDQRPDLLDDEPQREGHDAYATRQARILRSIASRFEAKWATIPALLEEGRTQVRAAEAEAAAAAESARANAGAARDPGGDIKLEDEDDDAMDEAGSGSAGDEEEEDDDDATGGRGTDLDDVFM
ncbi:hypothetical protein FB451DRAFT_1573587 [Mycena latifolia]|nr:hypothetical protein FB451DRAFT_1573587 [Mycena latifolia]